MSVTLAPVPAPARRRRRGSRRFSRRDAVILSLMAGVPTLIHVGLVWLPSLLSVALSFTRWNGIGGLGTIQPVGVENFHQIATIYPPFWPAVQHNLIWLGVFLFIATPLGLLLAVLLDKEIRGSRFYQSAIYLPVVLSLALVGFIWQLIYSTDQGLLNNLFGVKVDWFGDPKINLWAVLVAASWRHVGYIMVLYLAGLKSVDNSLREAATLDGSSEWQTFRHVVFPSLKPINVVIAVITVIEALRAFDIIFVLHTPRKTEVLSILTTNNLLGEGGGNVGRGSAYATILFVLCFGFVIWYVTNHYRNTQEGADS